MNISTLDSNYDAASLLVQKILETKIKSEVSQKDTKGELPRVTPLATALPLNSDENASPVDFSDAFTVSNNVKMAEVTDSVVAKMQDYAQGLSGLTTVEKVASLHSIEDSPLVNLSHIKVFLSKVEAGTATRLDLAQMKELLLKVDAEHNSGSHQQNKKQPSDSSENLAQLLLDELFDPNPLPGSSTDGWSRVLPVNLAQIDSTIYNNSIWSKRIEQGNDDNMKNINKQILNSLMQEHIYSYEKAAMQDLKA